MRRSTTSAGTEPIRRLTGLVCLAQLVAAVGVLLGAAGPAPVPPTPVATTAPAPPVLADGRTAHLLDLGGPTGPELLARIAAGLDDAAAAVTAFWGADWPREIVIAAAGTDEQFRVLAGGGPDIAAATVGGRIVFAPGAAGMTDAALRTVLRHELFHLAARARTAADAPRWLAEGVADYVARPGESPAGIAPVLPTDAELDTPGPVRSDAYDRAWAFAAFVADTHGPAALRALYLRACGPDRTDFATAVAETLGTDLNGVLAAWRRHASG